MIGKSVNLGEVCEILDTLRKPITKKFRKQGKYPYYGATGIVDYVDDYIFNETLVLIGEDGAKWDKGEQTAFTVAGKYWVNNHAHVVRPLKDKLNQNFLVYYLNSIDLKPWVTGLTVPKLNQEKLKSIPIPLFSLKEQKRIVDKLDLAFSIIDKSIFSNNQILESKNILQQRVLNQWIKKNAKSVDYYKVQNCVENKWIDAPFDGNHGEIHPKASDYTAEGVPFIMARDLLNGKVDLQNCKHISLQHAKSLRVGFAKDGDILFTHKGTIGEVSKLNCDLDFIMLTPQVTSYRIIDKTKINRDYLYYFFKSDFFQNQLKKISSAGATRAYIGITRQRQLDICIPSIDLQNQVVAILRSAEPMFWHLDLIKNQTIKNYKKLKLALVKKEFNREAA